MSEEIGLKPRIGSDEAPAHAAETDATPVVDAPLPGPPQRSSPLPSTPTEMSLIHYLDEPLWRSKGWMTFMGVLLVIYGALMALSIGGIILCWLPIWVGVTLMSAAKNIRGAAEFNDEKCLRVALEKIGLCFKIWGVVTAIVLVLTILAIATIILGGFGTALMMNQNMPNMMQ